MNVDFHPTQTLWELAWSGCLSRLLLFLPASSSQAEKELTDSPATSKRISFTGSSESPLSSKRPKTSEETKSEQVRPEGALLVGGRVLHTSGKHTLGWVGLGQTQALVGTEDSAGWVGVFPTDVPVSLLQVQQRRRQPAPGACHDAALRAAHAALPPVPRHAQQQDPPPAAPHAPPQCGTRLRGEAHYDGKAASSTTPGVTFPKRPKVIEEHGQDLCCWMRKPV